MAGGIHGNPRLRANIEPSGTSEGRMSGAVGAIPAPLQHSVNGSDRVAGKADHGWVARVIDRDGPGILRLLWRLLGREQDVMDAYQDCFCKLAARGKKGGPKNARAYAYRTAINTATEMVRVRSRRGAHWAAIVAERARDAKEDNSEHEEVDGHAPLREAVAHLPTHLRNVVVLRDLGRLSYNDVGRTLGIDPATARVYRRHAVVKLAELLGAGDDS